MTTNVNTYQIQLGGIHNVIIKIDVNTQLRVDDTFFIKKQLMNINVPKQTSNSLTYENV